VRDPTRVILRRSGAYAINATLTAVVLFGTVAIAGDVHSSGGDCPDPVPHGHACLAIAQHAYLMRSGVFLWFAIALAGLVVVAFVLPQVFVRSSVGKALLDVRTVRKNGSRPGFLRSSVRVAALAIDLIPLLLPVGLWLALLTPGHRRVGDFLAGTYVVRRSALGQPVSVPPRRGGFWQR
jgi:uncharacterized RDD family membrane protein YckC